MVMKDTVYGLHVSNDMAFTSSNLPQQQCKVIPGEQWVSVEPGFVACVRPAAVCPAA